ncbi:hypothetical protein BVG19_g1422 [[Candida] boidinii]|nr:hypothetical protein BVG19_g1422 [[Candida] boidinii]OWB50863.1 hypothetical protein B5S27_g2416 [[Candida] boidinii]
MTELASISLLLDTLSPDLPRDVLELLNSDQNLKENSLKFLDDLLSNENSELLLESNVQPSLDSSKSSLTLIEQVAELDHKQRNIEQQLKNKVISNIDKVLETNNVANDVLDLVSNDLREDVEVLAESFKNDDEVDDDDDEGDDDEENDEGNEDLNENNNSSKNLTTSNNTQNTDEFVQGKASRLNKIKKSLNIKKDRSDNISLLHHEFKSINENSSWKAILEAQRSQDSLNNGIGNSKNSSNNNGNDNSTNTDNGYSHLSSTSSLSAASSHLNASNSTSVVLRNMDNLMDILELPVLANACVSQGHYAECVEIASHVRRLAIRYSDIPIILEVEAGIQYEIREMVTSLIRLLHTDIKQSSIMKIISYLKRIGPFSNLSSNDASNVSTDNINNAGKMNYFSSATFSSFAAANQNERNSTNANNELLMKIYLKSRFQFIISELEVLSPLKNSNAIDRYLKRCLEVIREHCFATLMTFDSIFPNERKIVSNNDNTNLINTLISEFIVSIAKNLCKILKENIPKVNSKSVKDGLILQLIYCSQSLGRVGGDFNVLILHELESVKNPVITKKEWCTILRKQKELIRSLSKDMNRNNALLSGVASEASNKPVGVN